MVEERLYGTGFRVWVTTIWDQANQSTYRVRVSIRQRLHSAGLSFFKIIYIGMQRRGGKKQIRVNQRNTRHLLRRSPIPVRRQLQLQSTRKDTIYHTWTTKHSDELACATTVVTDRYDVAQWTRATGYVVKHIDEIISSTAARENYDSFIPGRSWRGLTSRSSRARCVVDQKGG